jgi:hypothetical protein
MVSVDLAVASGEGSEVTTGLALINFGFLLLAAGLLFRWTRLSTIQPVAPPPPAPVAPEPQNRPRKSFAQIFFAQEIAALPQSPSSYADVKSDPACRRGSIPPNAQIPRRVRKSPIQVDAPRKPGCQKQHGRSHRSSSNRRRTDS